LLGAGAIPVECRRRNDTTDLSCRPGFSAGLDRFQADTSFEDCVLPRPVPKVVRYMRYLIGFIQDSELDKIISMLIAD
jgi:hypothetical protein